VLLWVWVERGSMGKLTIFLRKGSSKNCSIMKIVFFFFLSYFKLNLKAGDRNFPCLSYSAYFKCTSSSSSCSLRVRCIPCSLILKVELVHPSLLWSSNVPSSFWSIFQCLSWQSISVHPLYVL